MEGSSMDSAGLPGQSSPSLIGDSQLDSTDFFTNASDLMADLIITEDNLSDKYLEVAPELLTGFFNFSQSEQMDLQKKIIQRMGPYQIGTIDRYIRPMLQRDFIAHLPQTIAEYILRNLDYKSLSACEWVSTTWRNVITAGQLWRKLIEKHVKNDNLWRRLSEKREWKKFIMVRREEAARLICAHYQKNYEELKAAFKLTMLQHQFYKELYSRVDRDITNIDDNWKAANFNLTRIQCGSEQSKGVYCLQYDDEKIVSGLRDNTIKIWDRRFNSSKQVLSGHTGSVLCLQYDDKLIISGSSDATVRVWDVNTGECLKTLVHHTEAVLDLRFSGGVMVTCSKDRSIAVWDMASPKKISINQSLAEHSAAVNAVDFDERYIVSASGDKTIMVWSAVTKERVRTLSGHRRGIACLQYKGHLVVSGSSDNTIRLWNVDSGECLRVLEGHEELVRCIRFDDKRIVSGAYDGKIKIWDLPAALDPKSAPGSLCLSTLVKHTGRVFRLQFDGFQIVSSSHDDTILIWDFFDAGANQQNQREPVAVPVDQDEAIGAEENERGP